MDTVSGAFTPLQPAQLLVDIQQRQQAQQSAPVAENAGSHSAGQSSTQLLLQPPGPVYEVQESDKAMRLQQLCAAWLATLAEASASNRDLLTVRGSFDTGYLTRGDEGIDMGADRTHT